MDEEGLLNMEYLISTSKGEFKPNLLGGLQIQPIGALEQNVNLGMILICKRDHN